MTNKEKITRNIGLSFNFLREIIRNPEILNSIENNSYIEFVEKDFSMMKKTGKSKHVKYYRVKSNFEEIKK
jgi:hypothetical protein